MRSHWWLLRPDALRIWRYRDIRNKLKRYLAILEGRELPLYLIAKGVRSDIPLEELKKMPTERIWRVHSELRERFKARERSEHSGASFLEVKVELADRLMRDGCELCERRCRAKRIEGERGVCGVADTSRVSSYFLHLGEEAPLVPSGTIFFSGCNLICVYCQNWDISRDPDAGFKVTPETLSQLMRELELDGAKNVNLVGGDPIPHAKLILEALLRSEVRVPIIFNSNLYATGELIELLVDVVDLFLPDFKYGNDECAKRLSGVDRYWQVLTRNLRIIGREDREVIIRHLVLPGHLRCCTEPVSRWISEELPGAIVNLMDQYRPEYLVSKFRGKWYELSQPLSHEEYEEALKIASRYKLTLLPL